MSQTADQGSAALAGWPEGLLETVLASLRDGVVVRDAADGRVVYANAEAARLTGFATAEELLHAPDRAFLQGKLAAEDGTPLDRADLPGNRALAGEEPEPLLVRVRLTSGGPDHVVRVSALPVRDASGGLRHVISVFRDVTLEHRLGVRQSFAAGAGVALAGALDYRGALETVAALAVPAFADWCGVDLLEGGQSVRVASAGAPLEQAPFTLDVPLGAYGVISFAASERAHPYDEFDLVLARDLAARAAAAIDNALLVRDAQETSALLDALFASAPAGVGFWDADLRFVRANGALEAMTDLFPHIEQAVRDALVSGAPVHRAEVSGPARTYLASLYPVVAPGGETIGIGAIVEDVTDSRRDGQHAELQHAVTRILAEAESADAAVPAVLAAIGETLGWDVGCYWPAADPERPRTVWLRNGFNAEGFVATTLRLDLSGETLPGRVAASQAAVWLDDLEEAGLPRASIALAEGLASGCAFPIVTDAGVSGVVELFARAARPRDDGLLDLLRALGSQLGQFLERKRSEDERLQLLHREQAARAEAETAATTLRRLERITDAVLTHLSLGDLLNALLDRIVEVLEADCAAILLLNESGELERRAGVGAVSGPEHVPVGRGLAGTVAATRRQLLVADLSTIEVASPSLRSMNSAVAIPLVVEDALLGVLYAGSQAYAQFVEEDARLLELMTDRIAFAVHQAALREAERQAQERLQFLGDASALLGSSLDVGATLRRVAKLAVPHFADWCLVDLLRRGGRIERVAIAHADTGDADAAAALLDQFPARLEDSHGIGQVIRTGRAALTPLVDERDYERAYAGRPEYVELLRRLRLRSTIVVPLRARGRTLGALSLGRSASDLSYGRDELRFAEELGARAAVAVDNAQLFHEAEESRDRLGFLAEASALLGSSLDVEHTLEQLSSLLVGRTADWCAIHLVDEAGAVRLVTVAARDPARQEAERRDSEAFAPGRPAPAGVREVIRKREGQLFTDMTHEPGTLEEAEGIHTGIVVPLIARDRAVGAISLVRGETPDKYTAADLEFARDLARRAAIAIDNAQLFRAAEERAQAARVLASVGDGVFFVDRAGVVRTWNRAAEVSTGLQARHVVDRLAAEVIPGWQEVAARIPVASGGAAATRAESLPLEVEGRELWLSLHGVAVPDGVVYAFRDLTEERALERMRNEFVSTVSHELRTPLAAIYGAAMTLRRTDVALDEGQRARLLEVVSGEADRLARTVNDILWASRLDTDTLHVNIQGCDPLALARDVIRAQSAHLDDKHELVLDAEPGLPPVAGDPDKVGRVLINLVDNAVKYSPDGGPVVVRVARSGSRVRFSVADRGLGIPPAEQRRIFEKFYRLDPDMTRGVGGTGLGLYICRELAHRMDGRLWVESPGLGYGSTFTFELPTSD